MPKSLHYRSCYPLLLLAPTLLVLSCSPLYTPFQKKEPTVRLLELHQQCAGSGCAEFSLEVYSDGVLRYIGKAYTPMMGTFSKKLPAGARDTLLQQIQAASIWSIPESFPIQDPNQPVVQVRVFEGQHVKAVTGQALPLTLAELVYALRRQANADGWVQVAAPDYGTPPGLLPNVLRVQLKTGINPEYWQGKYYEYGMSLIRMLPEASNLWAFRFDPSYIAPLTMKEMLNNDPDVVSVAFEKARNK